MKVTSLFVPLLIIPMFLSARSPLDPVLYAGPARLPNTAPEMLTPGYWISRHPKPDEVIMNSEQISRYNDRVNRQGTYTKIWQASSYFSGTTIRRQIESHLNNLASIAKYDSLGARTNRDVISQLRQNAALDKIPGRVSVRFGFPVSFAEQRLAPSSLNLNKKVLDVEFNEVQNSGYDIGTPTVFYHESADGKWIYGACATSVGWYAKDLVCFVSQSDWLTYQNAPQKVVSLPARGDLWADSAGTKYLTWCRMGTAFPYLGESEYYYRIQVPLRTADGTGTPGTAYIAKEDAHLGYLPYTARNVYKQAFRMLNMPYGWADSGGDYDCSSLLQHIFGCFGINLPRNGLSQVRSGKLLHTFTSRESEASRNAVIIREAKQGITLLRLEGHIMLYLGETDGNAYALHDTWGYREKNPDTKEDDIYVINRTVVSDLRLGEKGTRGSLLKKLLTMSAVTN